MNLVADESVDWAIVKQLRQDKYDVVYIAELSPSITDNAVLQEANKRQALLLTADKDFGELVYRQELIHTGVILLRLAGLTETKKAALVSKVFLQYSTDFVNAFSVISPNMVRIRHK